jgi:hypothetical protein
MPGAKVAQCAPRQTCGCTLPAFYVGTCGLVIGGGQMQMPASPYTSPAGQFVVTTGCS